MQTDRDCIDQDKVKQLVLANKPNIFLLDAKSLLEKAKEQAKCVVRLEIKKQYPDTVSVVVISDLPILKIEGTSLFVDSQHYIKESTIAARIPSVFALDTKLAKDKQVTDKSLLFAVSIAEGLKNSDFILSQLRQITDGNIIAYNTDNAYAIFSSNIDATSQLNSLQKVLAKSKIDATKLEKIDLRFDKPIVVLKSH